MLEVSTQAAPAGTGSVHSGTLVLQQPATACCNANCVAFYNSVKILLCLTSIHQHAQYSLVIVIMTARAVGIGR
jgi:hypothetical protein